VHARDASRTDVHAHRRIFGRVSAPGEHDGYPRALIGAVDDVLRCARQLCAAIHALEADPRDEARPTYVATAASRELSRLAALRAAWDGSDDAAQLYECVAARVRWLDLLLSAGLHHVVQRCEHLADTLAEREEWTLQGADARDGTRAVDAADLGRRLGRLLAE
jgi:hypothetical protein